MSFLSSLATFLVWCCFVAIHSQSTFQNERRCAHKEITDGYTVVNSSAPYTNHPYTPQGASATFQTIRIQPYYDYLVLDVADPLAMQHARDLVESAIAYVQRAVAVVPVDNVLHFDRACATNVAGFPHACMSHDNSCNDGLSGLQVQIPADHLRGAHLYDANGNILSTLATGSGITNADLVIYLRSDDAACTASATVPSTQGTIDFSGVNTWGATCRRDQYGRPTAAYMNLCPPFLARTQDFRVSIKEIVHHLYHILGFSESLFDGFRKPDGSVRPLSEIVSTNVVLDPLATTSSFLNSYPLLITPLVKDFSQSYYACNTFPGAPLETFNEMQNGLTNAQRKFGYTSSSHWHTRFLFGETMNPTIWKMRTHTSGFTLRLLQDSGWYDVKYNDYAEPLRWAWKSGCLINPGPNGRRTMGHSIAEQCDPVPDLYCYEYCDTDPACTYDGFSQADCPSSLYATFSCDRTRDFGGIAVAGANSDPKGFLGVRRQSDWIHACADPRTDPADAGNFYREDKAGFVSNWGNRNSRCVKHSAFASNTAYCAAVTCNGYDPVTQQYASIGLELTRALQGGGVTTSTLTCTNTRLNSNVLCGAHNGPVPELGGYVCPPVDSYCVTSRPFWCRFGWWSDSLNKCLCMPGMMDGAQCDNERKVSLASLTPGVAPAPNPSTITYASTYCVWFDGSSTANYTGEFGKVGTDSPPRYVSTADSNVYFGYSQSLSRWVLWSNGVSLSVCDLSATNYTAEMGVGLGDVCAFYTHANTSVEIRLPTNGACVRNTGSSAGSVAPATTETLTGGAIAGIVIGVLCCLCVIPGVVYYFLRVREPTTAKPVEPAKSVGTTGKGAGEGSVPMTKAAPPRPPVPPPALPHRANVTTGAPKAPPRPWPPLKNTGNLPQLTRLPSDSEKMPYPR